MINENQSIKSSLMEATQRLDGKAMIFCVLVSIVLLFMSFLEAINLIPDSRLGEKWVLWCFMPLIQFLLYVRFRQFSTSENKHYEMVSATLLITTLFIAIILFK